MKKFLRIASLIALPIVQSALLWSLFLWPDFVWYVLPALAIITDVLLFAIVPQHLSYSERFSITWPPLAMSALVGGVLLFIDFQYVNPRYILIGINALLQIIFLTHLYYHYYRMQRYQHGSLARATDYMNTLSVAAASAIVFALIFFLDLPTWYLLPPCALIFFFCTLQSLWINQFSLRQYYHLVVAIPIILIEAMYVLFWLPSIYYVNAFFIALLYSNLINLTLASARKKLTRRELVTSVILSSGMLLLLLVTTKWR